ncbi:MAG: hypothetical protein WC749_13495, partial [Dehalococcoidia bacterium]
MAKLQVDPRAYLGLNQVTPTPTGGGKPLTEEEKAANWIAEILSEGKSEVVTRKDDEGNKWSADVIFYQGRRYAWYGEELLPFSWSRTDANGDTLLPDQADITDPAPEKKEEAVPLGITPDQWDALADSPELKAKVKRWSEGQLTDMSKAPDFDPGPDNVWKAVKGRWTQVEAQSTEGTKGTHPPFEDNGVTYTWNPRANGGVGGYEISGAAKPQDKIGDIEIEDAAGNVWRYKTVNGEIDMSRAPVQVKGAKP